MPSSGAAPPPAPIAHPDVQFEIDSEPNGAEVLFSGRKRGTTPFVETVPWSEAPRAYTISKIGFVSADVTLPGNADGHERIKLRRKSGITPRSPGPVPRRNDNRGINPFD